MCLILDEKECKKCERNNNEATQTQTKEEKEIFLTFWSKNVAQSTPFLKTSQSTS